MSQEQLVARPVPGKWSTLEVICHLADFEIVGADRIKRVIAEKEPTLPGGDEKLFAARLAYHQRNAEEELLLIETIRKQVARILRTLKPDDFQRRGIHSEAGPLTLEALVQRSTGHIPIMFSSSTRNGRRWPDHDPLHHLFKIAVRRPMNHFYSARMTANVRLSSKSLGRS